MTDWVTFAAFVGVTCAVLLILTRLTERALTPVEEAPTRPPAVDGTDERGPAVDGTDRRADGRDPADTTERSAPPFEDAAGRDPADDSVERADRESRSAPGGRSAREAEPRADERESAAGEPLPGVPSGIGDPEVTRGRRRAAPSGRGGAGESTAAGRRRDEGVAAYVGGNPVTTGELLTNVAVTQGLFTVALVGAILYTGVPADALGISVSRSSLAAGGAIGVAAGAVLYAANEVGAGLAKRYGVDHDERLREMLAPETDRGWLALVVVVLPLIAIFEELLFRAALIGALAVGFGVSPWLLAVGSSILFALGHGVQGTAGIVVTGLLGFVLAAIFISTGSLLAAIVAHYVINCCEFVVHERLQVDWADFLEN